MNTRIVLFLALGIFSLTACKKDRIAPANQNDAFVKYYGHVIDQSVQDVKRVDADGGYLILGGSNSFATTDLNDFYLIKTDSLGNELWSKRFGDGSDQYEEKGICMAQLPDSTGFLIAGNRTEIITIAGQRTNGQTHIMIYQIDLEGNVVWQKALMENNPSHTFSDFVTDIRITPEGGFVLVGETTDVDTGKPGYPNYVQWDKTDALLMKYTADGTQLFRQRRGFLGEDRAVDIEIMADGFFYIVTATTQNKPTSGTPTNPNFVNNILVFKFRADNGGETAAWPYGGERFMKAASACYDAEAGEVIILASVEDYGAAFDETNEGDLCLLRVREGQITTSTEDDFFFYGKTSGGFDNVSSNLEGADIVLIEPLTQADSRSFAVTATHQDPRLGGSEAVLAKFDANLLPVWSELKTFGRGGENGQLFSGNEASTVLPVLETVPGTTRQELKGYIFGATFDLGTNKMMGLVKTNPEGNMTPVED
jgi:uncharacterized protein YaaQ